MLVEIPEPINESEIRKQNEIARKRQKALYKAEKMLPKVNPIEHEKRVSLSDEESMPSKYSGDLNEGGD